MAARGNTECHGSLTSLVKVGASIEEIGQFLDHTSLAVTSDYLRRLEGDCDPRWRAVAAGIRL